MVGHPLRVLLCVCVALAVVVATTEAIAAAGPDDGTPILTGGGASTPTITGTLSEVFGEIETREPIRRAGLRASLLRQVQVTVPTVVVVDNAASYLYAISNWESAVRFPVLWDDGSVNSREDIARFVRAFAPKRVLRVSGTGDERWGGNRALKRKTFERVLSKAVDEKKADWQEAFSALGDEGIISPGIVVLDVQDRSWAAALALCAGRLEPAVFVTKPKGPMFRGLGASDADTLERAIERGARATGRSWEGIGDDIDAITLALNIGTLIKTGPGARDRLSTTDRIGRREANGGGKRWAWSGQIIGNESRGVYQVMCALFLTLDEGFVWDGYSQQQPWGRYDGTEAGGVLRKVGLDVEIHDQPRNTLRDWKLRMVRAVGESSSNSSEKSDVSAGSAVLFLMNSKGASNVFDLPGVVDGQGKPGQMPIFEVPAAMHMVHSFSLQSPMSRNTVGGRLLERGVYVYGGSVDEPFLGGFVPTPAIARRLGGSMSFAAAVHFDDGKVWKITVLGDPLVTLGPAGRRVDGDLQVDGAVDLAQRAKQRLKDGDYLGALTDLSMLGRDEAVSRVALALMKDKPEALSPAIALVSIPSLFRRGEYVNLLDAYERLDSAGQVNPLMQDLLWLSSPYLLARADGDIGQRGRVVALLRANIRKSQPIQDAEDLAMAMRNRSIENAVGVLESLRPTLNANQIKVLDRAIKRVRR